MNVGYSLGHRAEKYDLNGNIAMWQRHHHHHFSIVQTHRQQMENEKIPPIHENVSDNGRRTGSWLATLVFASLTDSAVDRANRLGLRVSWQLPQTCAIILAKRENKKKRTCFTILSPMSWQGNNEQVPGNDELHFICSCIQSMHHHSRRMIIIAV